MEVYQKFTRNEVILPTVKVYFRDGLALFRASRHFIRGLQATLVHGVGRRLYSLPPLK